MAIKTYIKGRKTVVGPNFASTEFDCQGKKCCSNTLISEELVTLLSLVRKHFGGRVKINSGYRCATHNADPSVGGAKGSKHIYGIAADITVYDAKGRTVDPLVVSAYIDSLYPTKYGIEVGSYDADASGYVHVDVRSGKWRSLRPASGGSYTTYSELLPTVKSGSKGAVVTILARKLKRLGYFNSTATTCGDAMVTAIRKFQSAHKLTADGVFGKLSWAELIAVLREK